MARLARLLHASLDGKRSGGKTGRCSPGKRPIIIAVQSAEGKPERLKVRRIARFKRKRVKSLAKRIVASGAFVVTDGLACFRGVADAGCIHHPIATGRSRHGAGHPAFHWVNTVLANIKTAIPATYKAVRKKHLVRTLAEFEWRINNRENHVSKGGRGVRSITLLSAPGIGVPSVVMVASFSGSSG